MVGGLSGFFRDVVAEGIVLFGLELVLSDFLFDAGDVAGGSGKGLDCDWFHTIINGYINYTVYQTLLSAIIDTHSLPLYLSKSPLFFTSKVISASPMCEILIAEMATFLRQRSAICSGDYPS